MILRAFGTYLTATALVVASLVSSQRAFAQDEADAEESAGDEPAAADDPGAEPATEQPEADAEAQAASQAQADAEVGVKLDGRGSAEAEVDVEQNAEATKAKPAISQRYGDADEWKLEPYGYARFDAIRDSTQSFNDNLQPFLIARAGTYKGQHPRAILSAKDSRVGLSITAPEFEGIRTSAKMEMDFFGIPPTDAKENDQVVFGPMRLRHAFLKLENSIVDVTAGQTHDLFGWGGYFYPATGAFLGVPGQLYHRNPQLRLEKKLDLGGFEIMAALAGVRAGQRDSGWPDGQAGLKFAIDGWKGAAMQGFGRPSIVPLQIGVSGMYRKFEAPVFRQEPGAESMTDTGYGAAVSLMAPVIPAETADNRGNALTLTGEFSVGSGIADMYTGMDGGSRPPLLPNLSTTEQAYIYPQNFDPGLITINREWELDTVNWQAFVVGLQYYLPVDDGRIWISGVYSRVSSDNLRELTPIPSRGGIFDKMEYIDATAGFAITPAVLLGFSFQTLQQTFGDVSPPTPIYGQLSAPGVTGQTVPGTGGKRATARNNRGQLTVAFFF